MLRNVFFAEHFDDPLTVIFPKCFTLLDINVDFNISEFFSNGEKCVRYVPIMAFDDLRGVVQTCYHCFYAARKLAFLKVCVNHLTEVESVESSLQM